MKQVPNMRVQITNSSIESILNAGGCVSYKANYQIFAEGKPDHLNRMVQLPKVTTLGEIELVPTTQGATNE